MYTGYTEEEIKRLPDMVDKVFGPGSGADYDLEGILKEHLSLNKDKETAFRTCIREYLLNCHLPINIRKYRDLKIHDLLYYIPLSEMPLYLNRSKSDPKAVQEVIATWRIYIGK